jgi:hypothetical protein
MCSSTYDLLWGVSSYVEFSAVMPVEWVVPF